METLGDSALGANLTYLEETGSTNDEIKYLLVNDAEQNLPVVLAERQISGRGRYGRKWVSNDGASLTFSFAWPITESVSKNRGVITLAVAVALAETFSKTPALSPKIKYPNDLHLGGKKVAGILTEVKQGIDGKEYAVIGVGINVHDTPDFKETPPPGGATCLADHCHDKKIAREEILATFLENADEVLSLLDDGATDEILSRYRRFDGAKGREVVVAYAGEKIRGEAEGVDDEGRLVIRLGDGRQISVLSGEINFVNQTTLKNE